MSSRAFLGPGAKASLGLALAWLVVALPAFGQDASNPTLRNTQIRGCRVAVSSYDKNWRYPGGGRGRLVDCQLENNDVDVRLDGRSRLTLERCATDGHFELPEGAASDQIIVIPARGSDGRP